MDIFETLRTAFKIVASGFTQNDLIATGLVALLFMIAWSALSLLFNQTTLFRRNCLTVIKYLRENSLTKENYSQFIALWQKFPASMRYAWKRYEIKQEGLPSDYLKQDLCLDSPALGGIQKQNRSFMRAAIISVVFFITVVSIAIIGTTEGSATTKAPLTTTLFADAMIVPLVTLLLLMVNYYIYTNIRHQEYKIACDYFYDLLDVLDDRVDLQVVFGSDTRTIGLISNIYPNETMELMAEKSRKNRGKSSASELRVGKAGLSPLKNGVLGVDQTSTPSENVISAEPVGLNKLSGKEDEISLDTSAQTNFKIRNEVHFVEVVNCVEVLLNRIETEENKVKRQAIEREVNTLIKALTEYKQKAKVKQAKKPARKKA